MSDLPSIAVLLSRRCFIEAMYFGTIAALRLPSAEAHMFAGIGCCGCAEPLAIGQRLLDGMEEVRASGLIVSPATELPYEGFFHLIEAVRLNPAIKAPENLREVIDAVADDLAYISRRELHRPPDKRRRYTLQDASVSAAMLLRRLTGSDSKLPGVALQRQEVASKIVERELTGNGGDATFY
jgi:hypothetical protein